MRRVLFILIFFVVTCSQVISQNLFLPLDEDFNTWIDKTASDGKEVYVFSPKSTIGYKNADFRISKWNGLFWTKLPTIEATNVFYGDNNQLVMDFYNNQLVVAGSFYANDEAIKGICTWDGANWKPLSGGIHSTRLIHDAFSVNDISAFEGDLFVCGDFDLADGQPVKNFVRYTNGNWLDISSENGVVTDLEIVGDTLFASGTFTTMDGVKCNNLAAYYNNKWHPVTNTFSSPILTIVKHNSTLVIVTTDGFYQKNGNSFDALANNLSIRSVDDVLSQNNRLYASGQFITQNNDSLRLIALHNASYTVYLKDNEVWSPISKKILLNSFKDRLIITGSFQKLKGKAFKHAAVLKPGSSILRGQVYIDNNGNCVFDSGDDIKQNAIVSLNNGAYYTSTNATGDYSLFIDNNQTSIIQIFPSDNEIPMCNGSERTVRTTESDSVLIEHFALKLNQQGTPIKVSLTSPSGYQVKHGYTGNYVLSCATVDSSKYPIVLTLRVDERLTDFNASIQPLNRTNQLISWKLEENQVIDISYRITPTTIFMHDELYFQVEAHSIPNDEYKRHTLTQEVVSAFDPNDKQCDKYELSTTEERLEYLVRFQNLGNDNARNIHIVDTIDQTLPIEFIQILKNSHYQKYSTDYRVRDHAIVWSFKDIELPPKNAVGDAASSGFVAYECALNEKLTIGDEITNTAYIYFDFQPPVITNTTRSVVVKEGVPTNNQTQDILLYPNPSNGLVSLLSKNYHLLECSVYSTDGKEVFSTTFGKSSLHQEVDLSSLPVGVYFVKVGHRFGFETATLLVY